MMGDWVKGEVTAANLTPGKDILCAPTPRSGPASFNWISNSLSFFDKKKGTPPRPTDKSSSPRFCRTAMQRLRTR